jgi:DNA repair protein RadC
VHNHPSGNPKPSKADIQITGRLRRASAELEMPMLDHLIIGGDQIESVGGL